MGEVRLRGTPSPGLTPAAGTGRTDRPNGIDARILRYTRHSQV